MLYSQLNPILIVEDNLIDAFALQQSVETMGFQRPHMASTIEVAKDIINECKPSLILCDLFFGNKPQGIDLVRQFSNQSEKFIIITSCLEGSFYDETKAMGVSGHIIKPFHQLSLRSVIDHILIAPQRSAITKTPYLFIRGATNQQVRIEFNDILFIYSERNYMTVKTVDKIYTIKRSLKKMQEELDERFIRVHNSYIINTDYLKSIAPATILIHKDILPMGRAYRKNLTDKFRLIRNKEAS